MPEVLGSTLTLSGPRSRYPKIGSPVMNPFMARFWCMECKLSIRPVRRQLGGWS
ncbi:hypothetical protein RSAG8_05448, partial [Rhizoctonia solani AG-8 WAC10335]